MLGKIGFLLSIGPAGQQAIFEKLYENFSLAAQPFVHHENGREMGVREKPARQ
jgi:hypothetical protein